MFTCAHFQRHSVNDDEGEEDVDPVGGCEVTVGEGARVRMVVVESGWC